MNLFSLFPLAHKCGDVGIGYQVYRHRRALLPLDLLHLGVRHPIVCHSCAEDPHVVRGHSETCLQHFLGALYPDHLQTLIGRGKDLSRSGDEGDPCPETKCLLCESFPHPSGGVIPDKANRIDPLVRRTGCDQKVFASEGSVCVCFVLKILLQSPDDLLRLGESSLADQVAGELPLTGLEYRSAHLPETGG